MSAKNEISNFEKKLESILKGAFEKAIRIDDEFEIAADYDTHTRIDDLVKSLGLEVNGMSIAPSEFTITFKFIEPYSTIRPIRPYYCHITLENNGNYFFNLKEDDLKKDWFLGITDFQFNANTLSEEVVIEALNEMNEVMLLTILSS
jgi:hypothetical protein